MRRVDRVKAASGYGPLYRRDLETFHPGVSVGAAGRLRGAEGARRQPSGRMEARAGRTRVPAVRTLYRMITNFPVASSPAGVVTWYRYTPLTVSWLLREIRFHDNSRWAVRASWSSIATRSPASE